MTGGPGKRALPANPNPDYLRKEAKARLHVLRTVSPGARLAEAQSVLAREYGFANWAQLKAEVERRAAGPRGAWTRVRRAHVAVLAPGRRDGDEDEESENQAAFFRAGVTAQLCFFFTVIAGLLLLFLHQGHFDSLEEVLERFAQFSRRGG